MYKRVLTIQLLLIISAAYPIQAQEPAFLLPVSEHVEAELVSEVTSIQPGTAFTVAIRLLMDTGWHTYWRNSGDSGLPTQVDWQLPAGITAGDIQWPIPKKFTEPEPLVTFGYEGEVYLLVNMQTDASLPAGETVTLTGTLIWLECKEICIPGQTNLQLELDVRDQAPTLDSEATNKFNQFRDQLPIESANLKTDAVTTGQTMTLQIWFHASNPTIPANLDFFPYHPNVVDHSGVQSFRRTTNGFEVDLQLVPNHDKTIGTLEGILAGEDNWLDGKHRALYVKIPMKPSLRNFLNSFFSQLGQKN